MGNQDFNFCEDEQAYKDKGIQLFPEPERFMFSNSAELLYRTILYVLDGEGRGKKYTVINHPWV